MTKTTKTTSTTSALERVSAYAQAVHDGAIVAGPHVRNACRRHFDDLAKGEARGVYWDDTSARRVFNFFERKLRLSEGQFDNQPFVLQPMQEFILGSIFGWKRADGTRRFRRAYIEAGKGCGKSPLVGGIGLYGLVYDNEPGAQIYAAAATKDQASILFRDAVKMMRQSPDLVKKIKPSGGFEREYNLAHLKTASFFRPMSKEAGKTGSGLRPHFALCDEVHEHPGPEIMRMLEAGFKFRRQPLLMMITNSGSDRLSVCWREHEMACAVAAGTQTPDETYEYVGETWPGSDELFSYVCALDKDDDPLEDDSCWMKTNPLMGVTVSKEYIASQVAFAKNFPSDAPGILRLYFCVWTDAHSSWMPRKTVETVMRDFNVSENEGKNKPVFLGVDLSSHKDMTCVAYVLPTGHKEMERPDGTKFLAPTFDAWVDSFTPADTLKERAEADKAPYLEWAAKGYLTPIPGERIRYDYVAYSVLQASKKFDIKAVAYDQYAYAEFMEECGALGLELTHRNHPQGGLKRSRPDEALVEQAEAEGLPEPGGLWMPGSIREVESLIVDRRIRLRSNPLVMTALMAATFSKPDALGNKYLVKSLAHRRIDAAVALCMAVGAALDGAPVPVVATSPWDDPNFSLNGG
ncbi:terminase large subunit [Mesorhizobium retamae]|uniref:Terminase large subunit n=1 Tax=Mesorhizobium retamae TaxID=2912854 RepID=A0ABS9QI51_9HYPH|nr:terminase large subunit [Mesorhizobium sp. IRAMC:0171]MCG7507072.1 terminase large subunit [Mesorhizobium sp. IRAMC:0171]